MKPRHLIRTAMTAALLVFAGCATDLMPTSNMPGPEMPVGFVTQDEARHLAFNYRRRAAETSELARRLELETSVFSRQWSPNHEESVRRSAQVKELLAAAEEADELARIYGRQVPHGQVQ